MTLTKELKDLGCIILIDKNPKKENPLSRTYFRARIIYSSQTFHVTSRLGTISEYHIDSKGFDTENQVCKYILSKIKKSNQTTIQQSTN